MTFGKTALFHKAGEGSGGGGGGGGDQHNLGWYATEAALESAHPTANDGDWAIVGATDTVWVWDSDSTGWKDTGASGALQNMATGTDSLSVGKATTANNVVTVVNSNAASVTTAQGSAVVGSGAVSQARDGVAFGRLASVYSYNGEYGIAIGGNSSTRGRSGINIGYGAGSNGGNGDYGIAIGREAQAKQNYSIQLGNGSNNEAGTFYVASYYNSANVNYKLMDADGTIPTARFTTDPSADGTYYPTLTISSGTPTRSWSTISALQNTADSTGSLGILGSTSSGTTTSTAVGYNASCSGSDTTALGNGATASVRDSTAIGKGAVTSARGAIQIGEGTNSTAGTVCFGFEGTNYTILDANKQIPTDRLTKVNTTVTLAAADWSSNTQTVTVTGMTVTGVVLVSPDPTDQSAYTSAGILCTAQAADSLTFTATTMPTGDIDVVVVML